MWECAFILKDHDRHREEENSFGGNNVTLKAPVQ